MELHQLTIHELQEKIKNGRVSATQITESVFSRIDAVEERVHSYIRLMKEEAIAAAAKADENIKNGNIKPLTGIPIALKDIVCTKGITTTCGSHILHNFIPPYNATVMEKLRMPEPYLSAKPTWMNLPWVLPRKLHISVLPVIHGIWSESPAVPAAVRPRRLPPMNALLP